MEYCMKILKQLLNYIINNNPIARLRRIEEMCILITEQLEKEDETPSAHDLDDIL